MFVIASFGMVGNLHSDLDTHHSDLTKTIIQLDTISDARRLEVDGDNENVVAHVSYDQTKLLFGAKDSGSEVVAEVNVFDVDCHCTRVFEVNWGGATFIEYDQRSYRSP